MANGQHFARAGILVAATRHLVARTMALLKVVLLFLATVDPGETLKPGSAASDGQRRQPNLVYFLADDLGYGASKTRSR